MERVWPWSQLAYLRQELRATRLANSASDKRANRLTARIYILDASVVKYRKQVSGLEALLPAPTLTAIRGQMHDLRIERVPEHSLPSSSAFPAVPRSAGDQ